MLLPSGHADPVPEGFTALKSDTFGGYMLVRLTLASHDENEVERARAYAMQVEVYPLAEAGNPPPTVYTDAWDVLFDATIRYDASFFQNLNRIVQSESWLERDRLMIDYLRSIGIEKGQPFAPDAGMAALLNAVAQTARAWLEARYDAFYPGFFTPEGQWSFPVPAELVQALQNGYSDPDA